MFILLQNVRDVLQCFVCKGILYHNCCCWEWASKCPQCKHNTVVPLRKPEGPGKGVEVVGVDQSADDVDNDDDKSTVSTEVETDTTTTTTTTATTEAATTIVRASNGMYNCRVGSCSHRTKQLPNMRRHQAAMHDIDVIWYFCDEAGCEHRAKEASSIKKHKANVHGIDVRWFFCDHGGCEYRAKQNGNVTTHKKTCKWR